ncbi:growth inhibitor PemK [Bifidobacterium stellenboschense]|uniref:Growth inhibitor PemK n=2 Tax=Bifidobacterium stellenboschense TaxID=762211 RepID=A0A087DPU7_9BIFI|nr:growth inhibitor PemK [Bifidobacterium stellenboschense]
MWVEFPDHPGVGKPRPVVITDIDGDLLSGIVAKITGNMSWDEAGDVPLLDWKAEGLDKPSLVRCSQRFYFNRSELLRRFGRLSLRDAEHVNDGLAASPDVPPHRRRA